jgi:nicotinate-nucleotide adenylyltransferase
LKYIGLFGGTFNPIHIGHLTLAIKVYEDFSLDELIFIPSKIPPHKSLGTPPEKRYEMVKIAIGNLKKYNFKVSDVELKSKGVSYTYKTLLHYMDLYQRDSISFVCGSDIFATIEKWEKWNELFNLANFIVVNRKEMPFEVMCNMIPSELRKRIVAKEEFPNYLYGKIILHKMDVIEISSTNIREKLGGNEMPKFLTKDVYNYICKNKLYQEV